MEAKLSRGGNSLAVRLPAEIVRDLGFKKGQLVDLTANKPNLQIAPKQGERRYVNGIPVTRWMNWSQRWIGLVPTPCPRWSIGVRMSDPKSSIAYSRGEITLQDILNRKDILDRNAKRG